MAKTTRSRSAKIARTIAEAVIHQHPDDAIVNYSLAVQSFTFPKGRSEQQLQREMTAAEEALIRTPCDLLGASFKLAQVARSSADADGSFDMERAADWIADPSIGNEGRLLASAWLDIRSMDEKLRRTSPASAGPSEVAKLLAERDTFDAKWNAMELSAELDELSWRELSLLDERIARAPIASAADARAKMQLLQRYTREDRESPELTRDVVDQVEAWLSGRDGGTLTLDQNELSRLIAEYRAKEQATCNAEDAEDRAIAAGRRKPGDPRSPEVEAAHQAWGASTRALFDHEPHDLTEFAQLVEFFADQTGNGEHDVYFDGERVMVHLRRMAEAVLGRKQQSEPALMAAE